MDHRPIEVTNSPHLGMVPGNQSSFMVKCEPPDPYRMQSLHAPIHQPEMYNSMPVTTSHYQVTQLNQQMPAVNPQQLYNPMFHYPPDHRSHLQLQQPPHSSPINVYTPAYNPIQSPVPNYMSPPPPPQLQQQQLQQQQQQQPIQDEIPRENFVLHTPVVPQKSVITPIPVVPTPITVPSSPPISQPQQSLVLASPSQSVDQNFKVEKPLITEDSEEDEDSDEDDEEEDDNDEEISENEKDETERDSSSRRFRDDTIYDCPICKLRFTSQKKIESHVSQAHPGAKPYKCPICGLGLTRMTTYKEHYNLHTGEKPFECTVCHEKFGNSKSLYRHREKHETLAEKRCLQCKAEFTTWNEFKDHTNKCNRENLSAIHANTKPGDRPFICNVCGLGLSRVGSLNDHMNTHTGETPYACIWCKERFPNTKSLSRHREKHDLSNPKCCAKCQKEFNDWTQFKEHVNAGTCKVKLNMCHICNESFTRLPDLEKHFKVYHPNEDKLYSCTMCDKRFSHKNLLNTHIKTHAELPSHICQICGRQFIGSVQLQRHMCAVHGEKKTYDCPVCGVGIAQLKSLIEHVKTHVTEEAAATPNPPAPVHVPSMQEMRELKLERMTVKLEKDTKVRIKVKHEKPDQNSKMVYNPAQHLLSGAAPIKEEQVDNSFYFEAQDFFADNDHFMDGVNDDDDNNGTSITRKTMSINSGLANANPKLEIQINPAELLETMHYEMKREEIKTEESTGVVLTDEIYRPPRKRSNKKSRYRYRNALKYPVSKYPSDRLGELECPECGKRFMNLQNLNSHHIVHTGEKPYECHHCGVRLRYHKSLKRHMRLHMGDKNISCEDPDCREKFKTKNQMDIHMRQHTDEKRRYSCPLCDKSFYQKKILRQHLKIHGERNYKCEVCGRAFTENSRLREHMKVHTDDKPFLCSECGKNFRTKFSLDLHLKRHNNEARHLCKYCNKGFVVLSELKVHERTHTGEKPFVCPICYKHLSARRAVRAHMRIHTGEKPYACDWPDCPSVFRDKPSLRCHYRTHTGQKPFGCKFCDKHFTTSSNLRNHTARIHLK